MTGQPSILYYADTLFEQLGFSAIGGVLIGIFKVYIFQFFILLMGPSPAQPTLKPLETVTV